MSTGRTREYSLLCTSYIRKAVATHPLQRGRVKECSETANGYASAYSGLCFQEQDGDPKTSTSSGTSGTQVQTLNPCLGPQPPLAEPRAPGWNDLELLFGDYAAKGLGPRPLNPKESRRVSTRVL